MSMFDRLADLETELDRLEATLPDLYASGDQRAAADAHYRRHARDHRGDRVADHAARRALREPQFIER